jgi:hypothetical protein
MSRLLDPRYTFDNYVVGTSNRLVAAAARRAAESPGTSYNPLVIQGSTGLGKTHLLNAIGHLALSVRPELQVVYDTMESYVDRLAGEVASGTYHFREEHLGLGVLLLDDLPFLTGKGHTQAELLWIWEALVAAGSQVVLTSDRPLAEIDGMDQRLISRFSGGLIVEVTSADLEMRTAIVERKAAERGAELARGVAEAVARISFESVREMQEKLSRVLAVQDLERRQVSATEVFSILGAEAPAPAPAAESDEFSDFLSDISYTVAEVVEATPWRQALAGAILRWEGEGVRTQRLEQALESDAPADVAALIEQFAADVARLREIEEELAAFDPRAGGAPLLRDPDRLRDAERLLAAAHARARPRPPRPVAPVRASDDPVEEGGALDRWFFDREKIAWSWVAVEDRVVEELG